MRRPVLPPARRIDEIYARRFGEREARAKAEVWIEIARFLQRYVDLRSAVLDLACDRGEFIRNISAREKWASDVRDVSAHLPPDVRFVRSDGLKLLDVLEPNSLDIVFMSNYLEHLSSAEEVVEQLRIVRELLRSGGRAIVLQPNIRLVGGAYWDYIDHAVPLTEKSLVEAGSIAGLTCADLITRFVPYTTKSRLPQRRWLVRAYLHFPPAWRVLGKQTLYVGERR